MELHARQKARGDKAVSRATMACDRVPHRGDVPHTQAGQSGICESANACQNWAKWISSGLCTVGLFPQLLQQRPRLLEVGRVKALREPAIDRREQLPRFGPFALLLPEAAEAHGGAQLQRF